MTITFPYASSSATARTYELEGVTITSGEVIITSGIVSGTTLTTGSEPATTLKCTSYSVDYGKIAVDGGSLTINSQINIDTNGQTYTLFYIGASSSLTISCVSGKEMEISDSTKTYNTGAIFHQADGTVNVTNIKITDCVPYVSETAEYVFRIDGTSSKSTYSNITISNTNTELKGSVIGVQPSTDDAAEVVFDDVTIVV